MGGDTEYYDILNLSKGCEQSKVKSAYRKMALKYHPDKNPSPEAAETFKKVAEAYEVLSDEKKRAVYDSAGKAGLQGGGGMGGGGGPGGGMGGFSAEDIFSSFFGGGGGRRQGGGGTSSVRKPRDLLVELRVSLEEFYCGTTKEINVRRRRKCQGCDGTRSASKKVVSCSACGGRGQRVFIRQMGGMQMQQVGPCDRCNGKKTIPQGATCNKCSAQGFMDVRSKLKVQIRKGMVDGEVLRLDGEGDQLEGHDASGDIMIILNEEAHPYFARRGAHLWVKDCQITLSHLVNKLPIPVETLDGRVLSCIAPTAEALMNPSRYIYSVSREGFALAGTDGNEKGNLYLDIRVILPKVLNDQQQRLIADALGWKAPAPTATATTAGGAGVKKKPAVVPTVVTMVPWDGASKEKDSAMGEGKAEGQKRKKAAKKTAAATGGQRGGPAGGGMPQGVHVQQCPQQ